METYAQVLSFAIPGFILLIIIEDIVGRMKGVKVNRAMDTISSLSSGMTNTLKSILGLGVVIISYSWLTEHLALFKIESTLWLYVLAFVGIDFASYWSHRFNHQINIFWNRHIIHHSSEEYNLSCALRQEASAFVGVYFFLYIPMAFIGIPAEIVAVTAPLHLFAQFWYHTTLIGRMGFLEYILMTPSHHRVHHAINPEYIDKNYSAIFVVWDKWFGTFQEEIQEVPPVYGTKRPSRTWNPLLINYMHMWLLVKDCWYAKNWWDKARLWFMPTGWRPEDVKNNYPVKIIQDVSEQVKYDPPGSFWLKAWSWAQLVINNLLMYFILVQIAEYQYREVLLYSLFILLSIFAYTTLMDGHKLALPVEFLKMALGFGLIFQLGNWFGLDAFIAGGTLIVAVYLVVSFVATLYFSFGEEKVGDLSMDRIKSYR